MGEGNLVAVIDIEERAASCLAHDIQLFAVVCNQPVQCAKRNPRFLIHQWDKDFADDRWRKKRLDSLHDADLALRKVDSFEISNRDRDGGAFHRIRLRDDDCIHCQGPRLEMDDQNLTPITIEFFVSGKVAATTYVIVRYRKIDNGWESHVVFGKAPQLNNIYMTDETRDELADWYLADFTSRPYVTRTLDEAQEYIARKSDQVLT